MIPAFEIEWQRRQGGERGRREGASRATSGRDYHFINIALQKKQTEMKTEIRKE